MSGYIAGMISTIPSLIFGFEASSKSSRICQHHNVSRIGRKSTGIGLNLHDFHLQPFYILYIIRTIDECLPISTNSFGKSSHFWYCYSFSEVSGFPTL